MALTFLNKRNLHIHINLHGFHFHLKQPLGFSGCVGFLYKEIVILNTTDNTECITTSLF